MSAWVEQQQQLAFGLYSRYTAMGLHFKEGNGYNYADYGGKLRLTLSSFLKSPTNKVSTFRRTLAKIQDINQDAYLFANFRVDAKIYSSQLSSQACMEIYKDWMDRFGSEEAYCKTSTELLANHRSNNSRLKDAQAGDFMFELLFDNNPDTMELIAWFFQRHPIAYATIVEKAKDNAIAQYKIAHILKLKAMYNYLNIL